MFDPSKESGEGWDTEIRDDVIEECSRHGDVHHVHVDKNSVNGVVLVSITIILLLIISSTWNIIT